MNEEIHIVLCSEENIPEVVTISQSLSADGLVNVLNTKELQKGGENYYVIVAKLDDHVVGFAVSSYSWGKLHIEELGVKKEIQRKGIGKKIIEHLIIHAKEKKLPEVYCEVKAINIARPYDVLNKEEARGESEGNPYSFLHVTKPEIDLPDSVDHYAPQVYQKGKENYEKLIRDKIFQQDAHEYLYIYAQTMHGRTQYGLVGCASVDDYKNNIIKKHEKTLPAKEQERMNHIRVSGVQYEPVFFTYRDVPEINEIVAQIVKEQEPEYDFTAVDGIGHHFWVIQEQKTIDLLVSYFSKIPYTYVADGHHRTAAAALVGNERKQKDPNHSGNEEYNYFLAVHFPASHLQIQDYNRVIKDLNGLSKEDFLKKLEAVFVVENRGIEIYKPEKGHVFSMYLDGYWYKVTPLSSAYDDIDPIGCLDVTILSDHVLDKILGITDLRKSKRIDFIGGIRGLGELKKRVDSGDMAVAFALFPVTMEQLMTIADTGNIMPPKTTWFEPKLRSGLVIHSLD
ncbi:MAG: GNAT family N-acetyltransferase [Bacteroidia bacterium]|nr:GNAT family N-acetyltransferase [Bacteroidia bacterium]